MIREEQYHVCQIVFFSEMAANASDIVSADFAEILFSRNCLNYHDGDDNIG